VATGGHAVSTPQTQQPDDTERPWVDDAGRTIQPAPPGADWLTQFCWQATRGTADDALRVAAAGHHVTTPLRYSEDDDTDPEAERLILVNGHRIGGTYTGHPTSPGTARWISYGPAGYSMGWDTREQAETVQLAAWTTNRLAGEDDGTVTVDIVTETVDASGGVARSETTDTLPVTAHDQEAFEVLAEVLAGDATCSVGVRQARVTVTCRCCGTDVTADYDAAPVVTAPLAAAQDMAAWRSVVLPRLAGLSQRITAEASEIVSRTI
jgi:hypothetical protein